MNKTGAGKDVVWLLQKRHLAPIELKNPRTKQGLILTKIENRDQDRDSRFEMKLAVWFSCFTKAILHRPCRIPITHSPSIRNRVVLNSIDIIGARSKRCNTVPKTRAQPLIH
jgi:hypothetical protein